MKYTIVVNDVPPSLNEVINKAKRHWAVYASMKKAWKKFVNDAVNPNWQPFSSKVDINIILSFNDKRVRDVDNYGSTALKFGLDGLTKKNNPKKFIIYDDSENWINNVSVKMIKSEKRQTVIEIVGKL